jgi:hypothetical protein
MQIPHPKIIIESSRAVPIFVQYRHLGQYWVSPSGLILSLELHSGHITRFFIKNLQDYNIQFSLFSIPVDA